MRSYYFNFEDARAKWIADVAQLLFEMRLRGKAEVVVDFEVIDERTEDTPQLALAAPSTGSQLEPGIVNTETRLNQYV